MCFSVSNTCTEDNRRLFDEIKNVENVTFVFSPSRLFFFFFWQTSLKRWEKMKLEEKKIEAKNNRED